MPKSKPDIRNYSRKQSVVVHFFKHGEKIREMKFKRYPFLEDLEEMATIFDSDSFWIVPSENGVIRHAKYNGKRWTITLEKL